MLCAKYDGNSLAASTL